MNSINRRFFVLPLVPAYDEHMDDGKHFTKSNINVSYAHHEVKKSRDWYETQLTVSKAITRSEGYPENKPFLL